MPRAKVGCTRKVLMLPEDLLERIAGYRDANGLPSEVEAICRLLEIGLEFQDDAAVAAGGKTGMARTGRGSEQFIVRVPQSSEKYVVRTPDGLRDRIKAAAEANGRSMNAEIVQALLKAFPERNPS